MTTIILTAQSLPFALTRISNLPQDGTWEIDLRPKTKARSVPQNAKMWADLLDSIAEQAWVSGKQFDRDTWHYHLKAKFLPEIDDPELERKVRPGYRKWDITPDGGKILVGSTTKLTKYGMSEYMGEVEAYAQTDLGIRLMVREC